MFRFYLNITHCTMNQEDLKLDEKRQQSDTMMVQMLEL